jgi:hypothetical protein
LIGQSPPNLERQAHRSEIAASSTADVLGLVGTRLCYRFHSNTAPWQKGDLVVRISACLLSGLLLVSEAALGDPLQLERVVLSTGGVGYFEYRTELAGDGDLELGVRLDQVDDVLKSLVVYDDVGEIAAVTLPGRETSTQLFRDLPFGPEALTSPVRLFNALQGVEVEATGRRRVTGRILRVVPETVTLAHGVGTTKRHRLNLLTSAGVQQLILEEVEAVRFVDPEIEAQVDQALAALARQRVRDRRTLRIGLRGKTRRTVRVGYVVGVPLWKATYRLTVGAQEKDRTGSLQGWAVLENMSGEDWTDVQLSLVSGNPVTFRQALYTAYYVERPTVPVEVLGRILPPPDGGALGGRAEAGLALGQARRRQSSKSAMLTEMVAPELTVASQADSPADIAAPAMAARSQEAATQVSFTFPEPLSVPAGDSLVVPLADRRIPAERVALYQPQSHQTHPLASVRLYNDGDSGLPPGVLTLYQRSSDRRATYIGDARLGTLPAGDARLVSFAVDQKTRIGREIGSTRAVSKAGIERGVLRLSVVHRQTTTYRIKAPAQEHRRVLIEQARQPDWRLVSPREDAVELTEDAYRIPVELAAGSEATTEVVLERPVLEQIQVASLALDRVLAYASDRELSAPIRDAFAEIAKLKREVARHDHQIAELEQGRERLVSDQGRIRDNLARVPRDSDLYRRYMNKLDTQETELERLRGALSQARAARQHGAERLAAYIAELKV